MKNPEMVGKIVASIGIVLLVVSLLVVVMGQPQATHKNLVSPTVELSNQTVNASQAVANTSTNVHHAQPTPATQKTVTASTPTKTVSKTPAKTVTKTTTPATTTPTVTSAPVATQTPAPAAITTPVVTPAPTPTVIDPDFNDTTNTSDNLTIIVHNVTTGQNQTVYGN